MSFTELSVLFAVWGDYNGPLFLLKPETKKKEHYIQQQSLIRPLLFAVATKFNNLQFNYCNCLFSSTLVTIVHCKIGKLSSA